MDAGWTYTRQIDEHAGERTCVGEAGGASCINTGRVDAALMPEISSPVPNRCAVAAAVVAAAEAVAGAAYGA